MVLGAFVALRTSLALWIFLMALETYSVPLENIFISVASETFFMALVTFFVALGFPCGCRNLLCGSSNLIVTVGTGREKVFIILWSGRFLIKRVVKWILVEWVDEKLDRLEEIQIKHRVVKLVTNYLDIHIIMLRKFFNLSVPINQQLPPPRQGKQSSHLECFVSFVR